MGEMLHLRASDALISSLERNFDAGRVSWRGILRNGDSDVAPPCQPRPLDANGAGATGIIAIASAAFVRLCSFSCGFSSVHIITLESNLTGFAPLEVTALEALGNTMNELTVNANIDWGHSRGNDRGNSLCCIPWKKHDRITEERRITNGRGHGESELFVIPRDVK